MSMAPARRGAAWIAFILMFAVGASAHAQERRAGDGMRLAALAERISKLHAQSAHGVMAERSRRGLAEAARDFDALLRAGSRAAGAEMRESYLLLGLLWDEYRVAALEPATREGVRKLADRTDEVAWVASRIAAAAQPALGPIAAKAARVCVLSQRVPRLILMRRWDPRNGELARETAAAGAELSGTIEDLLAASQNVPDLAAQVQVARTQHGFLEAGAAQIQRAGAGARTLENVARTGDNILEAMQRVTRQYEELGL
ncbi:MAG: hypothetical protein ABIR98_08185 [Usitatibacter sp.]